MKPPRPPKLSHLRVVSNRPQSREPLLALLVLFATCVVWFAVEAKHQADLAEDRRQDWQSCAGRLAHCENVLESFVDSHARPPVCSTPGPVPKYDIP